MINQFTVEPDYYQPLRLRLTYHAKDMVWYARREGTTEPKEAGRTVERAVENWLLRQEPPKDNSL